MLTLPGLSCVSTLQGIEVRTIFQAQLDSWGQQQLSQVSNLKWPWGEMEARRAKKDLQAVIKTMFFQQRMHRRPSNSAMTHFSIRSTACFPGFLRVLSGGCANTFCTAPQDSWRPSNLTYLVAMWDFSATVDCKRQRSCCKAELLFWDRKWIEIGLKVDVQKR